MLPTPSMSNCETTEIEKRRHQLIHEFKLNKLSMEKNEYGSVYSFINTGKPELSQVIQEKIQQETNKINLIVLLDEKLKCKEISLQNHFDIINDFVNKNTFTVSNISAIMKEIECSEYFRCQKNYGKLYKKYGKEKTQQILLNKCINESDDHPLHVSKIVVKFD